MDVFFWAILRKNQRLPISNLSGQKGNKPLLQRKKKGPFPVEITNKSPQWSFNSESHQFVCFCWLVRLVYSLENYIINRNLNKTTDPSTWKTDKHAETSFEIKTFPCMYGLPSLLVCSAVLNSPVPFSNPPDDNSSVRTMRTPKLRQFVSLDGTFFGRRFWVWEWINAKVVEMGLSGQYFICNLDLYNTKYKRLPWYDENLDVLHTMLTKSASILFLLNGIPIQLQRP